jgi:hypothetical protein
MQPRCQQWQLVAVVLAMMETQVTVVVEVAQAVQQASLMV